MTDIDSCTHSRRTEWCWECQMARAAIAEARVAELEAAIGTVFDEIDMRHIEKHDEDTAHELHALKWVLKKEGGA